MQLIARQYFAAATAQEASRESSGRIYRNDDDVHNNSLKINKSN